MAQKVINVPDLSEGKKRIISKICKSCPEYLKEYLGVKELPSLDKVTRDVSHEFIRYKMNNESLDKFYTMCEDYLIQLVLYATNPGRIQSLCKRLRIFEYFGIKQIIDFGSGVGIDALVYSFFGIKSLNIEYPNTSRRFSEWLFKRQKKEEKAIFIPPDIFMSIVRSGTARFSAVQAIEIVAHLEDPYKTFERIMKKTGLFMWTNDIGLHREDVGNDPQHLPHNLNKVIESLNKHGEKVKIEGMAIPPRLWINRKEKRLWKKMV